MGKDRFNLHADLQVRVGEELFANGRRMEFLTQLKKIGEMERGGGAGCSGWCSASETSGSA